MDTRHLAFYVREVEHQASLATLAAEALNAGLSFDGAIPEKLARVFGSSQAILTAGAQLSKLMWADTSPDWTSDRRQFAVDRAARLRAIIKPSGILQRRAVRNSVEHYDARLDDVVLDPPRVVADVNIAPRSLTGSADAVFLRHYDPETNEYTALGHSVNIQDLFDAILDAGDSARQWLTSPASQ